MPQNVDIVGQQYIAINIVNVWWVPTNYVFTPYLCQADLSSDNLGFFVSVFYQLIAVTISVKQ